MTLSISDFILLLVAALGIFLGVKIVRRINNMRWEGFRLLWKIFRELVRTYREVPSLKNGKRGNWVCGSAREDPTTPIYQLCVAVHRIMAELTGGRMFTVEGGGPGFMEAGARGARLGGSQSYSFAVTLPHESGAHGFGSRTAMHVYMFLRKVRLFGRSFMCEFWLPGWGTLDELQEVLTLTHTKKCKPRDIFLMTVPCWQDYIRFQKNHLLARGLITRRDDSRGKPSDFSLFTVVDIGVPRRCGTLDLGTDQLSLENPVAVIGLLDLIQHNCAKVLRQDDIDFDPEGLRLQVDAKGAEIFDNEGRLLPQFYSPKDVVQPYYPLTDVDNPIAGHVGPVSA